LSDPFFIRLVPVLSGGDSSGNMKRGLPIGKPACVALLAATFDLCFETDLSLLISIVTVVVPLDDKRSFGGRISVDVFCCVSALSVVGPNDDDERLRSFPAVPELFHILRKLNLGKSLSPSPTDDRRGL
jgi:hypothetical protein